MVKMLRAGGGPGTTGRDEGRRIVERLDSYCTRAPGPSLGDYRVGQRNPGTTGTEVDDTGKDPAAISSAHPNMLVKVGQVEMWGL
jgi:hypothetical protein